MRTAPLILQRLLIFHAANVYPDDWAAQVWIHSNDTGYQARNLCAKAWARAI